MTWCLIPYVTPRVTVAFALAVLTACGSVFLYCLLLRRRAQFIVRTTYELTEEKGLPTVAELRRRFGDRLHLDQCWGADCSYTVGLSNQVLAVLHFIPYTEMKSYFWTRDGIVETNMVDYTTEINRRYSIVSHVQFDFCKGCKIVAVHPWDGASPLDTNGIVEIGSEASAERRRIVLYTNTGCLTSLSGCQSVADLLPSAWKQTPESKIACVIQNDRGLVEKPAEWP